MNYEQIYQPDPDQYQQIWPLIKNFAMKPRPRNYEDIFAQNIATAATSAKLYVASMIVYIVVSSLIIMAMGRQYTDVLGAIAFEPENLPLVIMVQCQYLIMLVLYCIMFAGLVHVGSTVVMKGDGEFDKIIFALFTVLSIGVMGFTFMYIGLLVLAQLGSSFYIVIRILWGVGIFNSIRIFGVLLCVVCQNSVSIWLGQSDWWRNRCAANIYRELYRRADLYVVRQQLKLSA